MVALRYKISLFVLKNISQVSAVNKTSEISFNTRRELLYFLAAL